MPTPKQYLSRGDFAERIGVSSSALGKYRLPEPDVIIGFGARAKRGWTEESVDIWNESRPGRGGRWS